MKQNYSTFAQRLKYIIGDDSLLSFSKKCNLSESAIRKYIREESEPTLQNLLTMAKVGKTSVSWLATGYDPFLANINLLSRDSRNPVIAVPEFNFNDLVELTNSEGSKNKNKEKTITEWVLSRDWVVRSGLSDNDLAIVQIPYNNMSETIKVGDVAIVSRKRNELMTVLAGIYVIFLNGKLLIKRIQYDPIENGYHLINDNPTFKNYLIKQDGSIQLQIVAKIERILTNIL